MEEMVLLAISEAGHADGGTTANAFAQLDLAVTVEMAEMLPLIHTMSDLLAVALAVTAAAVVAAVETAAAQSETPEA